MRIKVIFLVVLSLTLVTGIPAQSRSRDEQKIGANAQEELRLVSVSSLSDTEGVDFKPYLAAWKKTTQTTWEKLTSAEAKAPTLPSGVVTIRFKILANGQLVEGSMVLEGRSGSTHLDGAVWNTLTGSKYPPLPSEFHGPYLELRTVLSYNQGPES
jgi:hypothetical protein